MLALHHINAVIVLVQETEAIHLILSGHVMKSDMLELPALGLQMPGKCAQLRATLDSSLYRNAVTVVKQEVLAIDATKAEIVFKELWSDVVMAKASVRSQFDVIFFSYRWLW